MFFSDNLNNQLRDSLIVIRDFVNASMRWIIRYYWFMQYRK